MVLFGIQLTHRSSEILTIMMILSKFSTYKWHLHKTINTPTRQNILSVLICDLVMPKICLARNATFTNCPSWLHHEAKEFSHVVGGMDNLLNKDNSRQVPEKTLQKMFQPQDVTFMFRLITMTRSACLNNKV
jgi:hypothetical protein